jgi:hypothetical protein
VPTTGAASSKHPGQATHAPTQEQITTQTTSIRFFGLNEQLQCDEESDDMNQGIDSIPAGHEIAIDMPFKLKTSGNATKLSPRCEQLEATSVGFCTENPWH